jgi:ABC-2 type transport system permease protein
MFKKNKKKKIEEEVQVISTAETTETEETEEVDDDEIELEETEGYKKANFKEKLSLKFRKRLIRDRMHTIVLVIFLLLIFCGVNIWANSKDLAQIDVTENQLYSLTQSSKDQLKNLSKDVYIYIYGYSDTDDYVTFVKQYSAFNDKIHYEIVDEESNYEIVTKYDLNTSGYNTMVIVCGENDKTLYPDYEFSDYDYSTGDYVDVTEETITNAILNVSTDDPIKVYFASGDGEYTMTTVSYLVSFLEEQIYTCEELNLMSATEIPEDCDILAIINPTTDFNETEASVVKNYINNGGNIFFTMFKESADTDFTNLQSVLDLYGATIEFGVLSDTNSNNTYGGYKTILIPNLSSSNEVTSAIASTSSNYVIIPSAQAITITDVDEDNVTVSSSDLLTTSTKCYNLPEFNSTSTDGLEKDQFTVASEITRTMTETDEEGTETSKTSKLIIFGNSTFLVDALQIYGSVMQPLYSFSGNRNIVLNSFAELAEQNNLITVRKSINYTTFTTTAAQDRIVNVIIFGIPVLIIVAGIAIWTVRRRKR